MIGYPCSDDVPIRVSWRLSSELSKGVELEVKQKVEQDELEVEFQVAGPRIQGSRLNSKGLCSWVESEVEIPR
jgi:hypothetical protein